MKLTNCHSDNHSKCGRFVTMPEERVINGVNTRTTHLIAECSCECHLRLADPDVPDAGDTVAPGGSESDGIRDAVEKWRRGGGAT